MGRGAAPLQTSAQVFKHFLAPGNPGSSALILNNVKGIQLLQNGILIKLKNICVAAVLFSNIV